MEAVRALGVVFDIGHGMGGFGFDVGRAMLDGGFAPDVISSDVHALSADGPAFDLLLTMSKLSCLGMELSDVIGAATARPAAVLGRKQLGTLAPGSPGDAAILELEDGEFDYVDAKGDHLRGAAASWRATSCLTGASGPAVRRVVEAGVKGGLRPAGAGARDLRRLGP